MGRRTGWDGLGGVALALAACACGGDPEVVDAGTDAAVGAPDAGSLDAACPTPDAAIFAVPDVGPPDPRCEGARCGGDVTGVWELVSECFAGTGDGSFLRCPDGRITVLSLEVSATWTWRTDGSLTIDGSELGIGDAHLPLDCYGVPTCRHLEVLAAASDIGAECVPSPPLDSQCRSEACDCRITFDRPSLTLEATYAADSSAGTFTITIGSETFDGEYCVAGDELWMRATRFGGIDYRYRMRRVAP